MFLLLILTLRGYREKVRDMITMMIEIEEIKLVKAAKYLIMRFSERQSYIYCVSRVARYICTRRQHERSL